MKPKVSEVKKNLLYGINDRIDITEKKLVNLKTKIEVTE